MRYIAHRGNTIGKFESWENEPTYIDKAINEGFDVEVDVWFLHMEKHGGMLFLGHDEPLYGVNLEWFSDRIDHLWVHCKNIDAINYFRECQHKFNYFWHQNDDITLTSNGDIWAYPGKQPIKNSIAVMPELNDDDVSSCSGICSDYIRRYKVRNNIAE
jgi:hypothetical protein